MDLCYNGKCGHGTMSHQANRPFIESYMDFHIKSYKYDQKDHIHLKNNPSYIYLARQL